MGVLDSISKFFCDFLSKYYTLFEFPNTKSISLSYKKETIIQLKHPQMLKTYHGTFIQQLYAHNPRTIFKHRITGIWSKLAVKYNVLALYWLVMSV